MEFGLTDKVVLVTGATGGIGSAVVRCAAAEGARVVVAYHSDRAGADALVAGIGSDRALAVRYALEEPDSMDAAVAAVRSRWGGVDVLVAGAVRPGGRRAPGTPLESLPPRECAEFVATNLTGTMHTVSLVLPEMRTRRWGRIVLISSRVAELGKPGREPYGTVKSGLHGFTKSTAWDVGRDNVLLNTVSPGMTLTNSVRDGVPTDMLEREAQQSPSGKLSTPEDIARTVVFLGSAANGNITGQNVNVAGGR